MTNSVRDFDGDELALAAALDKEGDGVAARALRRGDDPGDVGGAGHGLTVDREDHIALLFLLKRLQLP